MILEKLEFKLQTAIYSPCPWMSMISMDRFDFHHYIGMYFLPHIKASQRAAGDRYSFPDVVCGTKISLISSGWLWQKKTLLKIHFFIRWFFSEQASLTCTATANRSLLHQLRYSLDKPWILSHSCVHTTLSLQFLSNSQFQKVFF